MALSMHDKWHVGREITLSALRARKNLSSPSEDSRLVRGHGASIVPCPRPYHENDNCYVESKN
jgi:hypothetical protein